MQRRYRRLFHFYDVQGRGYLSLEPSFRQATEAIAARWQGRSNPFPDLLGLLIATYKHEQKCRDLYSRVTVDEASFVQSHAEVIEAFAVRPEDSKKFIERAAGGFFDCLDLNRDGILELDDIEAYAKAYGKATRGVQANLARMLKAFELPPDRLPREIFLTLVTQYWFDPSPSAPGRWLFDFDDVPVDTKCPIKSPTAPDH